MNSITKQYTLGFFLVACWFLLGNKAFAQENAKPTTVTSCDAKLQILRDSFNKVLKVKADYLENTKHKMDKEIKALREENKKIRAEKGRQGKAYEEKLQKSKDAFNTMSVGLEEVLEENENYKTATVKYSGKTFETFILSADNDLSTALYIRQKGQALNGLGDLKKSLEKKKEDLVFATNAGMYTPARGPQGLLIIDSKELKRIDQTDPKDGTNFFLKPNGVFYIDSQGDGHVKETKNYVDSKVNPVFATQSGPMLVIDNTIHEKLTPWGTSEKVRSGVGIDKQGNMVFILSKEPTNFHTFARLFKGYYQCENALFLDGVVSRFYSKHGATKDLGGDFGPMIGISKAKKEVPVIKANPTKTDSVKCN